MKGHESQFCIPSVYVRARGDQRIDGRDMSTSRGTVQRCASVSARVDVSPINDQPFYGINIASFSGDVQRG